MPTFDVVSEVDMHEAHNAVDQANREVSTRFDFKDSGAKYSLEESSVNLEAQSEFQLEQMMDILRTKLAKRGVDVGCLEEGKPEMLGRVARQSVTLKQGIDQPTAKKMVKLIKESKLKVQASVQGDKLRVSGKKRDDLQEAIAVLRKEDMGLPLQFNNFRD